MPRASVCLLLLGCLSIGGVCAAGARCSAVVSVAEPSGCHEQREVSDQACCCHGQLTADQTAVEQTSLSSMLSATMPVGVARDASSGDRATSCLDHPRPPPRLDSRALLCVYLN